VAIVASRFCVAGEVTRLNSDGQFKPFVYLNGRVSRTGVETEGLNHLHRHPGKSGWKGFQPAAVQKIIAANQSGREDFNLQVFQLLTLELWQREFLDK